MSWRIVLPIDRVRAAALPEIDDAVLNVEEPDPARPEHWVLSAYVEAEPDAALLAGLIAIAGGGEPAVEELADADWVTLSQRDLEPVRAGRLLVHTAAHAGARRPGDMAIAIEAGLAFGTGQHATTSGCLEALWALRRRRIGSFADVGTGSGVLALAAGHLWPRAPGVASDIDPLAVLVARDNARANGVRPGRTTGRLEVVAAPGLAHPRLRGTFDLVLANILAAPLVALAGDLARAVAPGGFIVLAGLLGPQARRVRAAYTMRGLRPWAQHGTAEWPVLVLRRPVRAAMRGTAPSRPPGR